MSGDATTDSLSHLPYYLESSLDLITSWTDIIRAFLAGLSSANGTTLFLPSRFQVLLRDTTRDSPRRPRLKEAEFVPCSKDMLVV